MTEYCVTHGEAVVDILLFCWFVAYAFAELIDNALAATADNEGMREIDIRLVC